MTKITAFIPFVDEQSTRGLVNQLRQSQSVDKIFILTHTSSKLLIKGVEELQIDRIESSHAIIKLEESTNRFIFADAGKATQILNSIF